MLIMIQMFYISFLVVHLSIAVNTVSGQAQMVDIKMLKGGDGGGCALKEERQRALDEIHQTVESLLENYTCNGTPGWRRVAFINMTDTSYNCPTGLSLTSYSKRTCGRSHTNSGECSSTTFIVGGLPYSRVLCGRIKGYQFGATIVFFTSNQDINNHYIEGVSLTHGGPGRRQHIWTFAAGLTEVPGRYIRASCPCDTYVNTSLLLLEMITSVRVVFTFNGVLPLLSFPMTLCGMARTAQLAAHVVSSTILHGLQRTCLIPQQMILN